MSETIFLYGAAVQGIQGFIFQTNKLREIVGASELVEEICTDKFVDIFTQLGLKYDPEKCILHAAGNIKYIFDEEEDCRKIVRNFPKAIFEFAPGITVSQAVVKMAADSENFEEVVNDLEKKLRTQRNYPMRSATLGMMGIERSRQTGLPVALVKKETRFGKTEELHIDAGTRAKLYCDPNGERKKTTLSLCNKAFVSKEDFDNGVRIDDKQVAFNIEEITKDNDWIAIIHADGNGLGQVVQKVGIKQKRFKLFSEKLDEATTKSAVAAFNAVKGQFKNPAENPDFIPIRPIVLGGDDLTVICRADLALDYATTFLNEFENKTRELLKDEENKPLLDDVFELEADKRLTACAGIAYIKSSFPFYYGYELAEALCSRAKKDAKDKDSIREGKELPMSCLMFHKVQDSFTEDWDSIAKRELTPQPNISFEFGPYYLNKKDNRWTIGELKQRAGQLEGKEGNAVKSHLRNWMSLLHDNPSMAEQKLKRLKSMQPDTDKGKEMLKLVEEVTDSNKKHGDKVVFPVYDMLAIHTINTQKTKEDK